MLYESTHIRIESDDQIATLTLDFAGQLSNGFNLETLEDLERGLQKIRSMPWIDLLIVRSAKPTGFSPGHQLEQLLALRSVEERRAYAGRGQQVLQLFSALPSGTCSIAYIDGICESAGLELALACQYRVAVLKPHVSFAFPEIARGSIPCWGGTQSLTRRIGIRRALRLLVEGQRLSAGEAFRLGLLDRVFVDQRARIEFRTFLDLLQDCPHKRMKRADARSWSIRIDDSITLLQSSCFRNADKAERAASAICAVMQAPFNGRQDGLARERQQFAELGSAAENRHALELEQRAAQPFRVYPEPINPLPPLPQKIGIVGAGTLGQALAQRFLLQGHEVVLRELVEARMNQAAQSIDKTLNAAMAGGLGTTELRQELGKSLRITNTWQGFQDVGLVIEAADEELGVKRQIFDELERSTRPRTILATATTTLRIEAIQAEMQRPCRVAGLHFLDAALKSPVVELVRASGTDSDTLVALDAWLRHWKWHPVLVADNPGRLIQRVQMAYWSEAVQLVAEGLPPELLDREMRSFGMKQGPLEMIDAVGFDFLANLSQNMRHARGDRFGVNLELERMRSLGLNGLSTHEGFYIYRRGRQFANPLARMAMWRDPDDEAIGHYIFDPDQALKEGVDRLILRSINEAALSLGDEPDANPGTIDLALAWGAGWSPRTGGPLRYADAMGLELVVEQLTQLAQRCGKRFEPCLELQRRAEASETFYGTIHEAKQPPVVEWVPKAA